MYRLAQMTLPYLRAYKLICI